MDADSMRNRRLASLRRALVGLVGLSLVLAACDAKPPASSSPTAAPSASAAASASTAPNPVTTETGPMIVGRSKHTATTLRDGRVLIAGGYDADQVPLSSAELYDPATDSFSLTGAMAVGRGLHTATLLADGRVLIAGGGAASWVSASGSGALAELYDPKTGTFTPTGSMSTAREDHTATLLADGRVLIAGGNDTGEHTVASAELYDPTTGMFSPTGSMTAAHGFHTATLLQDGRVLVAGGDPTAWASSGILASADLYDPTTGTFTATSPMIATRAYQTATLLGDGRVLIAGGGTGTSSLSSAELYDPVAGRFTATGSLVQPRTYQTATLLTDGRVLLVGGDSYGGDWGAAAWLASAELYDPRTGSFTATDAMSDGRVFHQAPLLADGRVLVTTGDGRTARFAPASIYDPEAGTFSQPAPVPSPTPANLSATIGETADDGARMVAVEAFPLYDTIPSTRARDLTIDSPSVGVVKVRILLPSRFDAQPTTRWPVFYLLDGGDSLYSHWTQWSDIEELTAPTDLLVVMPDAGSDGWYSDWWNGGKGGKPAWETFHMVELRQLLERNWRAGDKRAIAGMSMGGYGAMGYASRHAGMFQFAASFSGPLNPSGGDTFASMTGIPSQAWGNATSQRDIWTAHDPTVQAEALRGTTLFVAAGNGEVGPLDSGGGEMPYVEKEIGIETTAFVQRLAELKIPVTAELYGAGTHAFAYTERDLQQAFPLLLKALGL